MNKVSTWLEGFGLLLAIVFVGLVCFAAIGLLELTVYAALLIIFIGIALVAVILAPYFFAKNFEVKSKKYSIKKIKKKERL